MAQGTVKVARRRHGVRFQRPGRRTTGVFVHHSAIQADGYRSLQENQRRVARRNRPSPQAILATSRARPHITAGNRLAVAMHAVLAEIRLLPAGRGQYRGGMC
jgi:cold shock protein